jgi:TetR/AcrR family transcriptional repressor of lmrAB and yxaGH operons
MSDRAPSDTRQRLIRAAEQLLRTQGYSGTGLKQLTAAAGAPWGSLYHFFPDGKAELAAEAARYAGEIYAEGWRRAFDRTASPGEAIERVFMAETKLLETSDYRDGCPIASMTMDVASTDERLRSACERAFGLWLETLSDGFQRYGAPADAADGLASFVLSAIEGAIVLSRAAKSPAPLIASAPFVRAAIDRAAESWR